MSYVKGEASGNAAALRTGGGAAMAQLPGSCRGGRGGGGSGSEGGAMLRPRGPLMGPPVSPPAIVGATGSPSGGSESGGSAMLGLRGIPLGPPVRPPVITGTTGSPGGGRESGGTMAGRR